MERNERRSQSFEANAVWQLDPASAVSAANQFMVQSGSESDSEGNPKNFYIRVGHVNPPALAAPPEPGQRLELPVGVLGNYFVTREELSKLRDLLTQVLGDR